MGKGMKYFQEETIKLQVFVDFEGQQNITFHTFYSFIWLTSQQTNAYAYRAFIRVVFCYQVAFKSFVKFVNRVWLESLVTHIQVMWLESTLLNEAFILFSAINTVDKDKTS